MCPMTPKLVAWYGFLTVLGEGGELCSLTLMRVRGVPLQVCAQL